MKPYNPVFGKHLVSPKWESFYDSLIVAVPFYRSGATLPIFTANGPQFMSLYGSAGTSIVGEVGPGLYHGGGGWQLDVGALSPATKNNGRYSAFTFLTHKFSYYSNRATVYFGNSADTDAIISARINTSSSSRIETIVGGTNINGGSVPEGTTTLIGSTFDGSTVRVYAYGQEVANGAATLTPSATYSWMRISKDVFTGSQTYDSIFFVSYVFGDVLTENQVYQLANDPFGIITPVNRVFAVPVAAGPYLYTIDNTVTTTDTNIKLATTTLNNVATIVESRIKKPLRTLIESVAQSFSLTRQGYLAPQTVTRYASSHTAVLTGWTNPSNAYSNNNVYATIAPANNATRNGDFAGFGFDGVIPAGSLITSVVLEAGYFLSTTGSVATFRMQAYVGGSAVGSEYTDTAEPTTETLRQSTVSYSFTRDNLLDANFKVRVGATRTGSATSFTASLDYIRVAVTYRAPAANIVTQTINNTLTLVQNLINAPRKTIASVTTLTETRQKNVLVTKSQNVTLVNPLIRFPQKSVQEAVTVNESRSIVKQLTQVISNTVALTQTLVKQVKASIAQSLTVNESRLRLPSKSILSTSTLTQTLQKYAKKSLLNSVTIAQTQTIAKFFSRVISNTVTLSQTLSKQAGKFITQSSNVSQTLSKTGIKTLAQIVSSAETRIKYAQKILVQSIIGNETRVKQPLKIHTTSVTQAQTLIKNPRKIIQQVSTVTQTLTRSISKTFLEAITSTQTLIKRVSRVIASSVSSAVTFSYDLNAGLQELVLNMSVATAQTLQKVARIAQNTEIIVTTGVRKHVTRTLQQLVTNTALMQKKAQKSFANIITIFDTRLKRASIIIDATVTTDQRISKLFAYAIDVAVSTATTVSSEINVVVAKVMRSVQIVTSFVRQPDTAVFIQAAETVTTFTKDRVIRPFTNTVKRIIRWN